MCRLVVVTSGLCFTNLFLSQAEEAFIEMGAVEIGVYHVRYNFRTEKFTTYFFNADGDEIGYFSHGLALMFVHHEPRVWGEQAKSTVQLRAVEHC